MLNIFKYSIHGSYGYVHLSSLLSHPPPSVHRAVASRRFRWQYRRNQSPHNTRFVLQMSKKCCNLGAKECNMQSSTSHPWYKHIHKSIVLQDFSFQSTLSSIDPRSNGQIYIHITTGRIQVPLRSWGGCSGVAFVLMAVVTGSKGRFQHVWPSLVMHPRRIIQKYEDLRWDIDIE